LAPTSDLRERIGSLVGEDNVSDDPGILSGYASAGVVSGPAPGLIARPSDTGQVREIVELAGGEGLNLVVSSSGPPRTRGGTVPCSEAVVVDMSGMDRIVRVDRRNKVALVEPGVTFSMLNQAAGEVGLKVLMPLLPRRNKSVLASCLEREPVVIPKYHWDMTDPLLCTELVFGTGDLFRTGSAAGPGSLEQQWAAGGAQKNPMGPAQTDFMRIVQGSQGTMAIVTWATVKLEVAPSIHRLYFLPDDRLSRLTDFSYRALRPKLADEFFILNGYALATIAAGDPARIGDLAAKNPRFVLVYGVSGHEYLPEKRVEYQERDIGKIAQATGLKPEREVPGISAGKMAEAVSNPSPEPYYKTGPKGAFLDLFFLTTLDRVQPFITGVEEVASRHGYPPAEVGIYIQPIQQGRSCHLEFTFYYDPEDSSQVSRTRELFIDAGDAVSEMGAFFSRPYGPWSDLAYARCPDSAAALVKVKKMLDPENILNRGKLCFKEVG
jgi:glycolate oxidase